MQSSKPHRLHAFTMLELTVSMLIVAIVIGITYTTYIVISKSYLTFKTKNEEMAILARIDQLLKRDFDQAELITYDGSQIEIQKLNKPAVQYEINDSTMVRTSILSDTFKVHITSERFLNEGRLKNSADVSAGISGNNRIDEFSFDVRYQDVIIPYHYLKVYSSETLIKTTANAIN